MASFDFHREPITSIEWHPTDDSIVAVASADSTLTLWDLAVELDVEESRDAGMSDIPPQLLFVHYMDSVKELHWQAQMPGTVMATGASGFGYVLCSLGLVLLILTNRLPLIVFSRPSASSLEALEIYQSIEKVRLGISLQKQYQ